MEQTKRMDNLDLMKALGILMVITIHVPLWKPEFMETDSVGRLVQYAFRIISEGVPIFVTINGLLLLKKKNQKAVLKNKVQIGYENRTYSKKSFT